MIGNHFTTGTSSAPDSQSEQRQGDGKPEVSNYGALAHQVVAGALFDLMGRLTTGETRYRFSAYDEAGPAVQALQEFAALRGLSLDGPATADWTESLASPAPELTDADILEIVASVVSVGVVRRLEGLDVDKLFLRVARAVLSARTGVLG